jgi:hypothetical protein
MRQLTPITKALIALLLPISIVSSVQAYTEAIALPVLPAKSQEKDLAFGLPYSPANGVPSGRDEHRLFEETLVFNAPDPPGNIGAPGNRQSAGGSRGCSIATTNPVPNPLTAIVPLDDSDSVPVYGESVSAHPTFWFYVPYSSQFEGRMMLEDDTPNIVYEATVPLADTPGLISHTIPTTQPPLEVGKIYKWYFTIYCEDDPIATVNGVMQRVADSEITHAISSVTATERVRLLARNGIWYDALTEAAELRQTQQQDDFWNELLRQVGLEDLMTAPILQSNQP